MTQVVRPLMFALFVLLTGCHAAQQVAAPRAGTVVEATVASAALKPNLLGDAGESLVAIYLPPSYATSSERRYPTLYLLHGYVTGVEVFGARAGTRGFQGMQLAPTMDEVIGRGIAREMIVVVYRTSAAPRVMLLAPPNTCTSCGVTKRQAIAERDRQHQR